MEGLEAFWKVYGSFLIENKGNLGGNFKYSQLKHIKQTKTHQKSFVSCWVCVWPFDFRLYSFHCPPTWLLCQFWAVPELMGLGCDSWGLTKGFSLWPWATSRPKPSVRQSDDAPPPQPSVLSGQEQTLICLSSSQLLSIARGAGCAQYFLRFGMKRQNNFEELDH